VLIDINGLAELATVDFDAKETRVGALTRYRALERDANFLKACPLFGDALPLIAHPQIRNRGTIGGNLSHADPASELPALALAMRARMKLTSARGDRELNASEFFVGLLTTDIQDDEMLAEIAFPAHPISTGTSFMEIARRQGDFALAGVAALVSLDEEGVCTNARIALCGVGDTPVDASDMAAPLLGERCSDRVIEAVAAAIRGAITPAGNGHASPDYQRHIAGVLTQRTLRKAYERARHAA
jgi:aerobic carbon-monoxide dehydrogenase medium subunit